MKSIFKKIAFVLALAMVVTAFPAKTAAAADEPWLKSYRVLYIGGDKLGDYAESAWASVKKGDYSVAFASEDEEIVTVNAKNGRLHAVSTGETVVTATFTKDGAEDIVKECKVVVKKNAATAALDADSEAALKELTTGDEVELKAVLTDADGSNEGISDGVRFVSDNKEVVTVDYKTGAVKAVAAGTANISVYAIQWDYSKADKKYVRTVTTEKAKYEVVVKAPVPTITGATVKSATVIDLAVENVTAEDLKTLKITSEAGGDIISLFKDPVLSKDGKTVTLTKYISLKDKEKLAVAFGDNEAYAITVAIGNPTQVIIDEPATAELGVATPIKFRVVDDNGIDLGITNVRFEVNDNTYAWVDNEASPKTITMYQLGGKVTLTGTYNTGKYDSNWNPISYSDTVEVVCVEKKAPTASTMNFQAAAAFDANKVTADSVSIFTNDTDKYLFAQAVLSNNTKPNSSANAAHFTFEALTPTVLIVDAYTGKLAPIAAGTAKVLVSFNDDTTKQQAVATVVVKPEAKLSTITIENNGASISNDSTVKQTAKFIVKGKDQYGQDYTNFTASIDEAIQVPQGVDKNIAATSTYLDTSAAPNLSFNGADKTKGSYVYRIKAVDNVSAHNVTCKAVLNVTVNEPVTPKVVASYKVDIIDPNVVMDSNPDANNAFSGIETVRFRILTLDTNGVANGVYDTDVIACAAPSVTVKVGGTDLKANVTTSGAIVYTLNISKLAGTNVSDIAASRAAIAVSGAAAATANVYDVTTGTITVSGKIDGRAVVPASFTSELKKTAPKCEILTATISAANLASVDAAIKNAIKIADGNADYFIGHIEKVSATSNNKGTSFEYVKYIEVYQKLKKADNSVTFVQHKIDINRYFTVTITTP